MTELSNKKYITKKISRFIKSAQNVLSIEILALNDLGSRLDESFDHACELMLACKGRIVITGMGKSGHIGRKIAATLASTGTPAFFVHPAEASHGDIGMITESDVIVAISYSGETPEILGLLPSFKQFQIPVIAICGKPQSTLAKQAKVYLNVQVSQEACPLGLAPTASTTASLAIGDALAIALLEERQFTANDFARFHPGGSLGKRLIMRVQDIMRQAEHIPLVFSQTPLDAALLEITQKSLGMTLIVSPEYHLLGMFTDGDLRRTLDQGLDIHKTCIDDVMTKNPRHVGPEILAFDALTIMEQHKITTLAVVNDQKQAIGVIHMHDLLNAGVIL